MTGTSGSGAAGGTTLGEVVDALGSDIIRVLVAPKGLDVTVAEPVIYDAALPLEMAAGDVVLAVGIVASRFEAVDLVRRAGAEMAAAVVVKIAGSPSSELVDAADGAGVALLGAPVEAAWGQLHTLLRTTTATAGQPPERGPGGHPMGDLFALANALAGMLGGAVTIEDPRSNVLAYSSGGSIDEGRRETILGRRVPDRWMRRLTDDGTFRRLYGSDEVVRIDYSDEGLQPRLAVAVRAGGELLGSIWVQELDREFGPDQEAALRDAGRIAALHLLRHRAGADLERARRAELLRSAIDGRASPEVLASALDVPTATPATVIAFELVVDPEAALSDVAALAERAVNLVDLYCRSFRRVAVPVAIGRLVYVLVPHVQGATRDRLPAFAADLAARVGEALRLHIRAAIGATGESLSAVGESREEADRVLAALRDDPSLAQARPVATVDNVRARVVLNLLRETVKQDPRLRAGRLDVLVESDGHRGTEYIATLRAYLDSFGDVPVAAAKAGVHPNTFRYRLRRLLEVADLDLDDTVERLVATLQLQFLD